MGDKMPTGINIICKKVFGQMLITQKPYCLINNAEKKELEWNKETFVPLLLEKKIGLSLGE